jgi:hypothetical protein
MTNQTRRTEIQIETHEVKVIRLRRKPVLALCGRCGEIVTALTAEQTAEVLELMPDDVFRLLAEQKIHLIDKERSIALICGNSFGDEYRLAKQRTSAPGFI